MCILSSGKWVERERLTNPPVEEARWKRKSGKPAAVGRLVPVELATRQSPTQHESTCPLVVVLSGGHRIEVQRGFDVHTFERLVTTR
jgi:hypothetical protein